MAEIIYRSAKGANLVAAEVDANFAELEERIQTLSESVPQPNEIMEISVTGNQMTIVMEDLSIFGPFTLPTAVLEWQGNWLAEQDWPAYSLFLYEDNLYMTLVALNTGETFVMGPNYQLLMPVPRVFDIGLFYPQRVGFGIPAGEPIASHLAVRPWFLLEDAPLSRASLRVATTEELVLSVVQNVTEIGTITFAASATVGVIAVPADVQFEAGDVMSILAPAAVDDTAKDLRVTFSGKLGEL